MINNIPLRIAVTGITGRMGKSIIQHIIRCSQKQQFNQQKVVLGAAIVRFQSEIAGMDVGTFMQSDEIGVVITDSIESVVENFDVLIDFTAPDVTMKYLKCCVMNNKYMIIGTTGLNQQCFSLIKNASRKIGIVYSANFSIGIAVMLKLLKEVVQSIGGVVDIDIIEKYHNQKKDIPSGTSIMMRNIIERKKTHISFVDSKNCYTDYCDGVERSSYMRSAHDDVKIYSIRAGNIVGEHSVLFSSLGECLEITHKASDRLIFAAGSIRSAIWLRQFNKIGLFSLNDVLGLNMS